MTDPLAIYLHDHLGGANFALELMETWSGDDAQPPEFRRFVVELQPEIESDRRILRQIADAVGGEPHSLKEAVGWLAEKASRYKLSHRDQAELARFQGLEMLALGILGKLKLWEMLSTIAAQDPRLSTFDFAKLAQTARVQHERVEAYRLAVGRTAFKSV